jgi:hypothetical protein
MKTRKIRWAPHVACTGEMRNAYEMLVRKPEDSEDLGIDKKIPSEWILRKLGRKVCTGCI